MAINSVNRLKAMLASTKEQAARSPAEAAYVRKTILNVCALIGARRPLRLNGPIILDSSVNKLTNRESGAVISYSAEVFYIGKRFEQVMAGHAGRIKALRSQFDERQHTYGDMTFVMRQKVGTVRVELGGISAKIYVNLPYRKDTSDATNAIKLSAG